MGTTVSLTNPGTVGTTSSAPRLMPGQGVIIATGALDYPAEYKSMAPRTLGMLGISKVMTVTSTYDHRIIQGAESGLFLAADGGAAQGRGRLLRAHLHRPRHAAPTGALGDGREPRPLRRSRRPRGGREADQGPAADPQLPRARPPRRGPRPARPPPRAAPRPRPRDLRPHALGPRPRVHDRRSRGRGRPRDAARDPRHAARDVLRHDRRRVHVHRRPRAQGVAAAPDGVGAQLPGARRRQQEARAREGGRGRELRALPAHEVRRPQALLARGRRGADPAARPDPERRGARRACARS